jgi:hypothetical protein
MVVLCHGGMAGWCDMMVLMMNCDEDNGMSELCGGFGEVW